MAILPTGFNKQLIYIETKNFNIHVNGNMNNKKADALKVAYNQPAFFDCIYEGEYKPIIKTVIETGELVDNSGYMMYPCFFEDGTYQIFLEKKTDMNLEIYHLNDEIRNNILEIGNNLLGAFEFSGEVGYSTFMVKSNENIVLSITIEVFPTKMDYRKDYEEIMAEINDEIASLAFEFLGKTYHNAILKNVNYQPNNMFINILTVFYSRLETAIKRIEKFPKHNIMTFEEMKNIDKSKKVSRKTQQFIRKHTEVLVKSNRGIVIGNDTYLPTKVIDVKKIPSIDIYENQFVKYILTSIVKRLRKIKKSITANYKNRNEYYSIIDGFEKNIQAHLNGFFKDIGEITGRRSLSLVFQMAPGYREVYQYYILLRKGLDLGDDIYSITPKKIWKLYEMWCYIKLHNVLKNMGYNVSQYGILKVRDNGLSLALVQDEEAVMKYSKAGGSELELWYNKSYGSLPTTSQKPDTVLCIKKNGDDDRIYIFDAKYRVQVDDNGTIGPMEDDINVMHRYRDAIVSELEGQLEFKYKTFGAYVMFPYGDEEKYKEHRFYKSIEKVNIGAFPMLPGSMNLIERHLESILGESSIEAKERILGHIVVDDDYHKFKLQNVMIGIVPDEDHLIAYRDNLFYHIPVDTISNIRLGIEYLAFHGSKEKCDVGGIRYYGKIKEIRRYKRYECKELPKQGDEEYLRIELEYVKEVGPIEPVEYGTETVSYTTLYLLLNAETVHELKHKSWKEVLVYKKLKEISKDKGLKLRRYKKYYMLGTNIIELLEDGELRINGVVVDLAEWLNDPMKWFTD